jgi:hypothetical protein
MLLGGDILHRRVNQGIGLRMDKMFIDTAHGAATASLFQRPVKCRLKDTIVRCEGMDYAHPFPSERNDLGGLVGRNVTGEKPKRRSTHPRHVAHRRVDEVKRNDQQTLIAGLAGAVCVAGLRLDYRRRRDRRSNLVAAHRLLLDAVVEDGEVGADKSTARTAMRVSHGRRDQNQLSG